MRADLVIGADMLEDALADADRNVVGIERTLHREQPVALLVLLADANGLVRQTVKLLADLHLDQRALFLDDDDEVETAGEIDQFLPRDRPRAADLEQADAEVVTLDFVDAEFVERLTHVEIGFAGRDDADLRRAAAGRDRLVDLVGAHESQHRVALVVVQPRFLAENGVDQPDVEPAFRHGEIGRRHDLKALEAAVDDTGRLDRVMHAFERGPAAGVARHRPAELGVIDDLLNPGRIEDRDHDVDEMEFGLMRRGRGFGGVVVAHQGEHAAVFRRTGEIGVAEDVAGTVDARPLAVPKAENAIELAFAAQLGLLRAPQRGGGEFLVQTGLEFDVGGGELAAGAHELLVKTAERRSAIAGQIAPGFQAGAAIPLLLHQDGADQRLIACDQNMALVQVVFVVEADRSERH